MEESKITYFNATVNKVKNNKALTIVMKLSDAKKILKQFEKDGCEYYQNVLSDSIKYSTDNAVKNVYMYISSKFPLKVVEESAGALNMLDVPDKSKVTIKLVNGYINMIRVDERYNPFSEF